MAKLTVVVFALIMLGTISTCQEPPDRIALVAERSGLFNCTTPIVEVLFNTIKVRGPDSDVVYERVAAGEERINFATDKEVALSSSDIKDCTKKAAREGFEAFKFSEGCYGVRLAARFLKCRTGGGSSAVYVRTDSFADEATILPSDKAPYKIDNTTYRVPFRVYMLSAFLGPDPFGSVAYQTSSIDDVSPSEFGVILENGDIFAGQSNVLDWDACLIDIADGVPLYIQKNPDTETPLNVRFLSECGKTIAIPAVPSTERTVYSHVGLGCKFYPTDVHEECVVTFKTEDSSLREFVFDNLPLTREETCPGLNVTIYGSSDEDAQPLDYDVCAPALSPPTTSDTFVVALRGHPTTKTFGFLIYFRP